MALESKNPDNPENYENSENPENPENPENSENSENLENPENPENPENSENRTKTNNIPKCSWDCDTLITFAHSNHKTYSFFTPLNFS